MLGIPFAPHAALTAASRSTACRAVASAQCCVDEYAAKRSNDPKWLRGGDLAIFGAEKSPLYAFEGRTGARLAMIADVLQTQNTQYIHALGP